MEIFLENYADCKAQNRVLQYLDPINHIFFSFLCFWKNIHSFACFIEDIA